MHCIQVGVDGDNRNVTSLPIGCSYAIMLESYLKKGGTLNGYNKFCSNMTRNQKKNL